VCVGKYLYIIRCKWEKRISNIAVEIGEGEGSRIIVTITVTGWAHKATLALRKFLIYCAPISDASTRALWQLLADTSSSEAEELSEKFPTNFACEVSLS
jgi:hypothetical protein